MAPLRHLLPALTLGSVAHSAVLAQDQFQKRCESFADEIDTPNVKVNIVSYVSGSTNLTLDNVATCDQSVAVSSDVCRVAMAVTTSNASEITLEAWFPRDYAGRFISTGNGGLGGCIQYSDLSYTSGLGFATVGANNGHNGTSGEPFYKAPEVLEDFVYRSVHTGIVVGKQLTDLFYDEGYDKSYYLGCSTGGRQGFKLAQDFPGELDGIVAGAPAINFVGLLSWSAHFYPITGPVGSATYLSLDEWDLVHEEVLRQCDGLDGAEDGIIEDTDLCHPNATTLLCSPGEASDSCLTAAQVNTVHEIYAPLLSSNGTLIYPRMQPGGEQYAAPAMYNGQPFPYSKDWWRYVVYSDPNWNATKWTVKDAEAALRQNPYNIQTWNADLSPLRDAGSKLLTYHGLQDQLISSDDSKLYYHRLLETMGATSSQLDEFYRFFQISGMAHCQSGDGAYGIGNRAVSDYSTDPEDNVLMAMVRWVEEGVPPETIRGAKFSDGVGSEIEYYRKHCRYPRRNVYKGPGNYTDENAWECI
ncbi:putative feruloyl esterase [Aspergillus mulundensis]|uniref:Carboxylic ester hydrolase n=1 Tax=Aspergillus mulundensis TaxID=1810919 RepID=A0A3D8S586_9EURO|nr:putative feruloyl esterase B [Aspergillus mulundensis]RDW81449.1 putative feruloyl esterase B [Aspergillus mulundensis]